MSEARTVAEVLAESQVEAVMDELDRDLIGLTPIKQRIRDIAALLVIDKLRLNLGLQAQTPSLHMNFTGNPGTGKTTVAMRMAQILHRLGYCRKGHLVAVTRDDLVGQYIGHTAPKTKEILKKAMGGVLFIDEAYYLYRPENERDYGQEAIEILLQVIENQRDDLVVILAGYGDRMEKFFESNPGFRSRIAHHIDFPDYGEDELLHIAVTMLAQQNYNFSAAGRAAFVVPALRKDWLSSVKEASRTAFATVNGWPVQEATNQTIVVGPPRTIRIRTKHRACDGTTAVWLTSDNDGAPLPELAPQPDGTFTAELGPGPYSVTASLCTDGHTASTSKDFVAARIRGVFDL